jgi:hypothetical protein
VNKEVLETKKGEVERGGQSGVRVSRSFAALEMNDKRKETWKRVIKSPRYRHRFLQNCAGEQSDKREQRRGL